ncbi:MAG: ATP-dependent DNA helicase UvrD2 [Chloroflexi bacterium]|nr:ATP-dependent DNA helicase UvrD2 [Chloroflexota bacterium]
MARQLDPETLLADLDPDQREAVLATSGPVAVHAGAGSGKTRVISRRTAYAIATGVVPADQVLVVTFTDRAANEMVERLRGLGLPGVTARTFHAHALSQLRHYWPVTHDGRPLPELLDSKGLIVSRLARQLPGHYRFTPSKDLSDEIEWSKARRIAPGAYEREAAAARREPPIPVDLFVRVYGDYERAKERANRIDFDDLLVETVNLLEGNGDAAATIRARKRWFSVDEYQDTNPLQQRLLELWLGDREDLCVVGDEDQTIYTFTGATSDYLTGFVARHPGAREITLSRNYRSTPQILALANRLLAAEGRRKQLVATAAPGDVPRIERFADADAEAAHLVASIRRLVGAGTPPSEIAILVRINAQIPPIEAALTKARIAFRVRGQRFFERPEVREAVRIVRRLPAEARGSLLLAAFDARLRSDLGFEAVDQGGGAEARERTASLALVLEIAAEAVAARHDLDREGLVADFETRGAAEAAASAGGDGVNLLTFHRAKGLEWDAVLLPQLEEGTLPIRQAESDAELAEERRLLYVGLTRARRFLSLSWAERRTGAGDREVRRRPSEFLGALVDRPHAGRVTVLPGAPMNAAPSRARSEDSPLMAALRAWRLDAARSDGVPAYVVAPDTLLADIADQRPTTLPALRRVKGMGPSRLGRYGEEMLEIVRGSARD